MSLEISSPRIFTSEFWFYGYLWNSLLLRPGKIAGMVLPSVQGDSPSLLEPPRIVMNWGDRFPDCCQGQQ